MHNKHPSIEHSGCNGDINSYAALIDAEGNAINHESYQIQSKQRKINKDSGKDRITLRLKHAYKHLIKLSLSLEELLED